LCDERNLFGAKTEILVKILLFLRFFLANIIFFLYLCRLILYAHALRVRGRMPAQNAALAFGTADNL
jgi:hypothetical protein